MCNILAIRGIEPRADLLESPRLTTKLRRCHDINLFPTSDHYTSDFWRCPTRAHRRVSQYCTQKHVVFCKYFAEMRPVPQTKLYTTEKWTKNGAHVVLISSFNERYSTFNSLRSITKQLSTTCLVFFAFLVGHDEKFPKYARHNKERCGLVLL